MSPRIVERSDMGTFACRPTRSCGATWATVSIEGPGLVERHARDDGRVVDVRPYPVVAVAMAAGRPGRDAGLPKSVR
jgi:hypothetical protein